jgi:hypothetical protein
VRKQLYDNLEEGKGKGHGKRRAIILSLFSTLVYRGYRDGVFDFFEY